MVAFLILGGMFGYTLGLEKGYDQAVSQGYK